MGLPGRCHAWGCGTAQASLFPPVGRPGSGGGDAGRSGRWDELGRLDSPESSPGWGGGEKHGSGSPGQAVCCGRTSGSGPRLPCRSFRRTAGSDGSFRLAASCLTPLDKAAGLHAHPQDASSLHTHPSALTPLC